MTKFYTRGEIVPFEEDLYHEFKGHRTISVENRMPDFTTGEMIKTRQQWSKYLCGMLNSGFGGVLYGGILDNGEVNGFMMSQYQIDHVIVQLDDLFERFSPPVPKNLYRVDFVPQIEPFEKNYEPDPVSKDPELEKMPHKLKSYRRCWCDNDAAASHSFGMLLPWYVIEVSIEKQSETVFAAEDGEVYCRRNGLTETMTDRNDADVECLRCGDKGHRAKNCPRPKACFKCGDTGHLEARCHNGAIPKNYGHQGTRLVAKPGPSSSKKYCHNCETHGHGVRECPEILAEMGV